MVMAVGGGGLETERHNTAAVLCKDMAGKDFLSCMLSDLEILTINVPLILKVREVIFFSRAKRIMEHFGGAETFITPKFSWPL
jgi:hypothetical protein